MTLAVSPPSDQPTDQAADRSADPFVVFEVTGDLDLHTQDGFERAVGDRLKSSAVVVDLSGMEFLAVTSLRSMMVCHHLAAGEKHAIVYAGAPRQARRLLRVAG